MGEGEKREAKAGISIYLTPIKYKLYNTHTHPPTFENTSESYSSFRPLTSSDSPSDFVPEMRGVVGGGGEGGERGKGRDQHTSSANQI